MTNNPIGSDPATTIRYRMVLLATVAAVLLYLDRVCLSSIAALLGRDLKIGKPELDNVLSAFFFAYALAQVPAGWIGDRFGARWTLGLFVMLWSVSTALLAVAGTLTAVLVLRSACGLFQAGAYPVSAGIVRRWIPAHQRGKASSVVAVGGRFGGWLAPILTVQLMLAVSYGAGWWNLPQDANALPGSWRPVVLWYGIAGMVFSAIFVWQFRDAPDLHHGVNDAERLWIGQGASVGGGSRRASQQLPLLALMTSVPLWMSSFVQFAANLGWAFLVTKMPQYLSEVHGSSEQESSWLQSLTLAAGVVGLFLGGAFTDSLQRWFGPRWGRSLALSLSRVFVAVAFVCIPFSGSALSATACLAAVGLLTDLGTPACWAFCQDVGGRHVAAVMGWANMWGNFGAAASPKVFGLIAAANGDSTGGGWTRAFLACAGVNLLAAAAAIAIDGRRSVVSD